MSLLGKIIKTAAVAVAGTTVAKKIKEKFDEKNENKMSNENNVKYIKVCDIVDEYVGANYKEAQKALIAYGFKNISFIAKKDLKRKKKAVDGRVETISFNGETEFGYRSKYSTNANVVIRYHTFIDAEDEQEVEWAIAKCHACGATLKYDVKIPKCPYCGAPIN